MNILRAIHLNYKLSTFDIEKKLKHSDVHKINMRIIELSCKFVAQNYIYISGHLKFTANDEIFVNN